jgi:hypothetical protein
MTGHAASDAGAPPRKSPFAALLGSGGGAYSNGDHYKGGDDADGEMIWNEHIADALGYGKGCAARGPKG